MHKVVCRTAGVDHGRDSTPSDTHSDAESQYAVRFTEGLPLNGIAPRAVPSAPPWTTLMETLVGLYQTNASGPPESPPRRV
jgi:hypothetical protein